MQSQRIALVIACLIPALQVRAEEYVVDPINKSFVMTGKPITALKLKKGDTVSFKNGDPFFHNIFSLSELQTFDLGSYPAGEARAVKFEAAGTVDVECAIHPDMHMTVEVE